MEEKNSQTFQDRLEDLRSKLNRMEMLDEIEQADLSDCAKALLTSRFQNVVQKATNDFLDQFVEPAFKATANSLLVELGLEELPEEVSTHKDVLEKFLSSFQRS